MRAWLLIALAVVALWALALGGLALAGKRLTFDVSCVVTLDFDHGCYPGKPYRIEDR